MNEQSIYGRNRQSIADIETELYSIFQKRSDSHVNDSGEPVIPASALVEVLDAFTDVYNGVPVLSPEEVTMLQALLDSNPGLEVTPPMLLQFIAQKTKASPPSSEDESRRDPGHSRSLSNESNASTYYQGPHSRPPSRGPPTPSTSKSPLDSERRQRSTPLPTAPPSTWSKRPLPAGRRKSDAGSRSDSENGPNTSGGWGRRTGSRTRAPSNPTNPSPSTRPDFSPGSPDFGPPYSRPHSRARSHPQNNFNHSFEMGYSSPDDGNNFTLKRPISRYGHRQNDSFDYDNSISTLPMPRPNSDSDEEDLVAGLVLDRHGERSAASSTVSMEIHDRLDALTRANEELIRKKMEAEQTLQNKLAEHDLELEENQQRLEELRSELNSSNREEKELRAKDSRNMAQIAALEAEMAKLQKQLDSAKATYSSLQKQYNEQCQASEKYRDDLRKREDAIRTLREAAALHEIETHKWQREHDTYEDRINQLEHELSSALEAHTHLDEQKQENLLLKETIDRMRFEMDEMRNAASSNTLVGMGSSGHSSAANTISKSLGAELAGRLNWGMDRDGEGDSGEMSSETMVDEDDTEVDEDEDVIQTIITKRKRKVPSRATDLHSTRNTFEELKEYSDSSTQYDPTLFAVSHGMQTEPERKPLKMSFTIQTDAIPEPKPLPIPPPRITVEMEIQTDVIQEQEQEQEREQEQEQEQEHDESMASSSSTVVPPATPKPGDSPTQTHTHLDQPPAYNQVTEADQEEREWRVAAETLKKWHNGVNIPFEPVKGGISEEAVEEWNALKQELGVECLVIDKIVGASMERAASSCSSSRSSGSSAVSTTKEGGGKARRGGRFYNIYNTYVYGGGGGGENKTSTPSAASASAPLTSTGLAGQALMFVGASALVILAMTPYMVPQYSAIPGGATYYDRAAWSSFNSMHAATGGEGFAPDGTAAVWSFLGRVGGGAARIARGWPT